MSELVKVTIDDREVEVDRPDRPVEVDLLVQEEARGEEHLERAEARLVERQPALPDERIAHEPLDIHRPGRHARTASGGACSRNPYSMRN